MATQTIGALAPAVSADLVKLHALTVNSLSRCRSMLLTDEPMYELALQEVQSLQRALVLLWVADVKASL